MSRLMVLNKKRRKLLEFLCDFLGISLGISNPQEKDELFPKGRSIILKRKIDQMCEEIVSFDGTLPKTFQHRHTFNLNQVRELLIEFEHSGETCDDTLIEIDDILRDSYNSIVWILTNAPTKKD